MKAEKKKVNKVSIPEEALCIDYKDGKCELDGYKCNLRYMFELDCYLRRDVVDG